MTTMIRFLAVLATCLTAGAGWADTRVRSGEHSTFTRLVFYLPGPAEAWSADKADDGYLVQVEPAPSALDTSDVFAFIPRTRISDVSLRDGKVLIESACDCHVAVFRARPDVIAIDVRDGPDPSSPAAPPAPETPTTNPIFPVLLVPPTATSGTSWQVEPRVAFVPPQDPRGPVIDSTDLATAVARAASGGLLRTNDAPPSLDGPGIETRSALDAARSDHDTRMQTALCSNMASLEELNRMSAADAWRVIDATDADVQPLQRAMAYMALGFGAEAANHFADSELSPDKAILFAQTAQFIDTPDRPSPRSFRSAGSCGGIAALLAVLGTPASDTIAEQRGREAVTALSRLPFPLRAHLAGYLERRLVTAGLPELAQSADFARLRAMDAQDEPYAPAAAAGVSGRSVSDAFSDRASLPSTEFFGSISSDPIYDTIAAGRFAAEDRILIEAWIKEAPTVAEADAASAFYITALNRAGRPLDALSYLDARFGRRGLIPPGLETAITETIDTATSALGPGELLVLGARLAQRPWFDRVPEATRIRFEASVAAVRRGIIGAAGDLQVTGSQPGTDVLAATGADPGESAVAADRATTSPRNIAAEAAIASATDALSRSARLRAEATERTAEWTGDVRQ